MFHQHHDLLAPRKMIKSELHAFMQEDALHYPATDHPESIEGSCRLHESPSCNYGNTVLPQIKVSEVPLYCFVLN